MPHPSRQAVRNVQPPGTPDTYPCQPPGRGPHRRGERAGKRGLSAEQVPALIARDRAGHTADAVLPDLGAEAIKAALAPELPPTPGHPMGEAQADAAVAVYLAGLDRLCRAVPDERAA